MKLGLFLAGLIACTAQGQAPNLPVWVEESHAGTFYFLAQTLPLEEPHTLVLFDAHSDANGIADSDAIRSAIRKVPSLEARAELFTGWRQKGRIQCFNWIEPLMPRPIAEVLWIPARRLDEPKRAELEKQAGDYLDAHQEGLPRDDGLLAPKFHVLDFEHWIAESKHWPLDKAAVASIDLDYFAQQSEETADREVEDVLESVLRLRGLKALTWSMSTPWLRSTEQADHLLHAALDASWRIANASVHWEPFLGAGPDHSMLATLAQRRGERLPEYDLAMAGPALRSLLLQRWTAETTYESRSRLEELLTDWRADALLPDLAIPGHPHEPDGSYRLEAGKPWRIVMQPAPTGARVRWQARRFSSESYRVCDVDFGFASDSPRWLYERNVLLHEAPAEGELDSGALAPTLDPVYHCGTVQVFADVIRDGEIRHSNTVTLHVRAAGTTGLRGAWSEHFARPYIFGSTWLRKDGLTGAEAGCGADCANFLIAGLRAEGWRIPWGSPLDLRAWLEPAPGPWNPDQGCFLDFGSHVAALWQNHLSSGERNDKDLVVHQLGGPPQVLPFAELQKGRPAARLMRLRQPAHPLRLLFGGDVMLGRRVAKAGGNPLSGLADVLHSADLALVNLECPILPEGMESDAKAPLAAPARAISWLTASGVGMVGLANNHSLDRGGAGLSDTLSALRSSNLRYCGAGNSEQEALQPVIVSLKGRRIAFLAVFADNDVSHRGNGFIASEEYADQVRAAIKHAREQADLVIVLPHWGREHSPVPAQEQYQLAEQWFAAGASLIIGSGPHIVQRLDHFSMGSVAWSLGNLVFDGPGPTPEWSRGALLEVTLDAETLRLWRMWLLPVDIAEDGRVHLAR